MIKILFQGDSITDVGRGYPHLIKAAFNLNEPNKYEFINRGIAGNRSVDIYARIKSDIINLAPDFMSVLFGVNDVSHEIFRQNGVSEAKFEAIYSMLIEEVRAALPNIKLLIMEPFLLPASATVGVLEDGSETYPFYRAEVEKRAAAARRVAEKYSVEFLPLQKLFDEAAEKTSPEYWLKDGVHPSEAGHALIAEEWKKAFERIMKS